MGTGGPLRYSHQKLWSVVSDTKLCCSVLEQLHMDCVINNIAPSLFIIAQFPSCEGELVWFIWQALDRLVLLS